MIEWRSTCQKLGGYLLSAGTVIKVTKSLRKCYSMRQKWRSEWYNNGEQSLLNFMFSLTYITVTFTLGPAPNITRGNFFIEKRWCGIHYDVQWFGRNRYPSRDFLSPQIWKQFLIMTLNPQNNVQLCVMISWQLLMNNNDSLKIHPHRAKTTILFES